MSIELTVPEVGESITEVQIGRWLKKDGDAIAKDEDLVEIETEKASVVVSAPAAGVLSVAKAQGEMAKVGEVIGSIAEGAAAPAKATPEAAGSAKVMPAAARAAAEAGIDPASVAPTGAAGHVLKEDVQAHVAKSQAREAAKAALDGKAPAASPAPAPPAAAAPAASPASATGDRGEEIRPMSMIRRTIATRLVAAQQAAALLTTFNEVDMGPVMELRRRYKEAFEAKHGVKLGFMSFFVKASVEALRAFPAVNAEVRGTDIVYRAYHDIGIAIGGGKGLVVPILRNAEVMSFADIERAIADFGKRAAANAIKPDELAGGTFTISNGGIYGSLLSTPIVNPPQSGILGMHAIQERPVVRDGQIVIRPMMYVAVTYDHRIIDGREAVTFLRTIKDVLEDPARLLLEV